MVFLNAIVKNRHNNVFASDVPLIRRHNVHVESRSSVLQDIDSLHSTGQQLKLSTVSPGSRHVYYSAVSPALNLREQSSSMNHHHSASVMQDRMYTEAMTHRFTAK